MKLLVGKFKPGKKAGFTLIELLLVLVILGVLAVFIYYNFFNTEVADALTRAGLSVDWLFINVFLPAGLSFYTLKKLAYMIDVSRGSLEPSDDLVAFGAPPADDDVVFQPGPPVAHVAP